MTPLQEKAKLDEIAADMVAGKTFRMGARSESSVIGYQPPVRHDTQAHIIMTLGRMARIGPAFNWVAIRAISRLSPGQTTHLSYAAILSAAAECIEEGWTDVAGKVAPDAGRPSDYERRFTLSECIIIDYWLTAARRETVGWALAALAKREGIPTYALPPAVVSVKLNHMGRKNPEPLTMEEIFNGDYRERF